MTGSRSGTWLRTIALVWLGVLAGFAIGIEWIRSRPQPPTPSGGIDLVGAGATLPYPLYRRWFAEYGASSGVRVNYFSVGSTEGIRLMLIGTADFGAADRPLTLAERERARCGPFEMSTVAGAVVVAYRLPALGAPLRLDADVLAAIILGRITRWDDPAIRALNPGVALPNIAIHVVQRARETGTTTIFSRYLATSARWRGAAGSANALSAAGALVEGNEGVTAAISARVGALGIVENMYAQQAGLDVAALRNESGTFVTPSAAATATAVNELLTLDAADTLLGVVGARAAGAYPAVAITRIMADSALGNAEKSAHFIAFARWALRDGARVAAEVGYAPLPEPVTARQLRRLDALRPGVCPATRGAP